MSDLKASQSAQPECPRGHGPMVRRENPTQMAAEQGVWWDCAPGLAGDTCMSSALIPNGGAR